MMIEKEQGKLDGNHFPQLWKKSSGDGSDEYYHRMPCSRRSALTFELVSKPCYRSMSSREAGAAPRWSPGGFHGIGKNTGSISSDSHDLPTLLGFTGSAIAPPNADSDTAFK